MAYNPQVPYRGDQYLFQSLGGIGEDIANIFKEREKNKQVDAYNDMVMKHAHDRRQLSEEDLNKYLTASHSAKTGMAAARAANIVEDWKQRAQTAQVQQHADVVQQNAVENEYRNRALQQQWDVANLRESTKYEPVVTDPLKVGEKDVPGIGVNRKTGQYIYFKESGIERDPGTGALGVRNAKGEFHPLNAQQVTAMDLDPNNPLRQTTTPQEKSWWQKMFGTGGESNGQAAAAQGQPDSTGKIPGKKYKDKDGNVAIYMGNGQWQPAQ